MYTENDIGSTSSDREEAVDSLNDRVNELRERLSGLDVQLRTVARERPLAVIGGALVLGYIIGRVVSR